MYQFTEVLLLVSLYMYRRVGDEIVLYSSSGQKWNYNDVHQTDYMERGRTVAQQICELECKQMHVCLYLIP